MPLRDVGRINTKLSNYFYDYGKACASRVTLLLVGSLCTICMLSLPTIYQFTQTVYSKAVPIPFSLDTFDGQFWLFSPHVQQQKPDLTTITTTTTATTTTTTPMHDITIKQVRLTNVLQQVDKELLLYAHQLQQTLTSVAIPWKESQLLSLDSLCYHRPQNSKKAKPHCLIHSPLAYWNSFEDLMQDTDWLETVNHQMSEQQRGQQSSFFTSPYQIYNSNSNYSNKNNSPSMILTSPLSSTMSADGLSLQPLSMFGNVTFDLHGSVVSADSIILTFFLQPDPYLTSASSSSDWTNDMDWAWNALWANMASKINMNLPPTTEAQDGGSHQPTQSTSMSAAWYQQANVKIQTWYYKVRKKGRIMDVCKIDVNPFYWLPSVQAIAIGIVGADASHHCVLFGYLLCCLYCVCEIHSSEITLSVWFGCLIFINGKLYNYLGNIASCWGGADYGALVSLSYHMWCSIPGEHLFNDQCRIVLGM